MRLPAGADLSFFYNESDNFTPAGNRTDAFGEPLPQPKGKTEEYGFNLSLFNNKLVLRANWFETALQDASINASSGGQGTFDRIIENVRQVADKVNITIGGNFDETSCDSYPALLDFLKEQEFADKIVKVNFKPIIKAPEPEAPKGIIPLTVVGASGKPLGGTCMTSAGAGSQKGSSVCDSCHFMDEKMSFLRSETRKRGFPTPDGVHMGPCEIHRRSFQALCYLSEEEAAARLGAA